MTSGTTAARVLKSDVGFTPARETRARVENHVAYVRETWFEGERFTSLDDARRSAEQSCGDVAGARVHGTTRRVPREHYAEVEKPTMQPAPLEPFDVPLWSDAKVHEDHDIQAQCTQHSRRYSALGRRRAARRFSATQPSPDDLLLPSREREMRSPHHTRNKLLEDLERLGLRSRRGHDLRRTFITLARPD